MNLSNTSMFDNHTNPEHGPPARWPGAVMIIFSLTCACSYVLCLASILTNKETARRPSYQIILHIGVTDLGQLLLNGVVGGIFSLCQSAGNFYLNKIIGGIMNSVWVVYITMAHLLAWNRLIHTYNPAMAKRIFTLRNTRIILGTCWLYGLAWIIAFMFPNLDLLYDPAEHNWNYGPHPSAQTFATCELSQDIIHCIGMAVCYTAIIFKLLHQSKQIINSQLNSDKKERLVLIQSMWLCMASCSAVLLFFFNTSIIPDHWAMFFATMVWLVMAGSNAFIYLIFNKYSPEVVFLWLMHHFWEFFRKMRRQAKELLNCGKSVVSPLNASMKPGNTTVNIPRTLTVSQAPATP